MPRLLAGGKATPVTMTLLARPPRCSGPNTAFQPRQISLTKGMGLLSMPAALGILMACGNDTPSSGCISDRECKGDRICSDGTCVTPDSSGRKRSESNDGESGVDAANDSRNAEAAVTGGELDELEVDDDLDSAAHEGTLDEPNLPLESFDPEYAGMWSGTTSAGHPVRFALLEDGTLAGFMLTIRMNLGTGTCTGPFTAVATPQFSGTDFDVQLTFPFSSPTTQVSGGFLSASTAAGVYTGDTSDGHLVACGDSVTFGSGGSLFAGGTWEATKCNACSSDCEYQNDGVCDEPSGLGLCFLGTDPSDCGSEPAVPVSMPVGSTEAPDISPSSGSCTKPGSEVISDFDDVADDGTFGGGEFPEGVAFAFGSVSLDTSAGALHLRGTVSDFSGGGVGFLSCVDASNYSGISLWVGGDSGPSGTITLQFLSDQYSCSGCFGPSKSIPVTASGQQIDVAFGDLDIPGQPDEALDTSRIQGISWLFDPDSVFSGDIFAVDVTIDDVRYW